MTAHDRGSTFDIVRTEFVYTGEQFDVDCKSKSKILYCFLKQLDINFNISCTCQFCSMSLHVNILGLLTLPYIVTDTCTVYK